MVNFQRKALNFFDIYDILLQDANYEDTQILILQYFYAFVSSRLKYKGVFETTL